MKRNRFLIHGIFLLFATLLFVACNKKEDTIVKIIVKDTANQVVSGASVTLLATPTAGQPPATPSDLFPMTTSTNSAGEAVFNLNEVYQEGQAGVAVLDIDATATSGATGQGIVKSEQEKEVVEVVFVQ